MWPGRQDGAQIGDVSLRVVEVLQQLAAVAQPREDRELALERILPEQVKLCQLTTNGLYN